MSEDKPEIRPEPNKPENKPEFSSPEPKSEFSAPEIKPQKKPVIKPKFKKEREHAAIPFKFKLFFTILILGVGIYFGTGPLIESLAKFAITRIFVDSTVSVGSLSIKPTHQISFFNVKISKANLYDVAIKEANLDFTFQSLFKKIPPELSLKDVKFSAGSSTTKLFDLVKSIKLSTKKKAPVKLDKSLGQSKGKAPAKSKSQAKTKAKEPTPLISKLDIPDLNIDLNLKDAKANAIASLSLNLLDKQLSFLNLAAKQVSAGKVSLEGLDLSALQGQRGKGILTIRQASLGKLKIKNITSKAVLEGLILSLDDISGALLSKKVIGDLTLNLWPVLECTANAKSTGISAEALTRELGWENKLKLSGRLYGKVIFRSEGMGLAMLNLNFISTPAGATLTITDPQTLRMIAEQSRQPLAGVSESFRDYRFEKGLLKASLLENTVNCEIILAGKQGGRNLKFVLKNANIFGEN